MTIHPLVRLEINTIGYAKEIMSCSDYQNFFFYQNLNALSKSAFPKKCPNCRRVFNSVEEFINKSNSVNKGSGLKRSFDDNERPIVELFRNCVCGSTLLDFFSDRRDLSEKGNNRRKIFCELLKFIEKKGLSKENARLELLRVMRGEHSKLLEDLGIKQKKTVD